MLCSPCALAKGVCAKCQGSGDIVVTTDEDGNIAKTPQQLQREKQEHEATLASMNERQRRAYLRKLLRDDDNEDENDDEEEDSDDNENDDDDNDEEEEEESEDDDQDSSASASASDVDEQVVEELAGKLHGVDVDQEYQHHQEHSDDNKDE